MNRSIEVEVKLNGEHFAYLTRTRPYSTGPTTREIAAEDQIAGTNVLTFHNYLSPNFVWGITDVLLEPATIA